MNPILAGFLHILGLRAQRRQAAFRSRPQIARTHAILVRCLSMAVRQMTRATPANSGRDGYGPPRASGSAARRYGTHTRTAKPRSRLTTFPRRSCSDVGLCQDINGSHCRAAACARSCQAGCVADACTSNTAGSPPTPTGGISFGWMEPFPAHTSCRRFAHSSITYAQHPRRRMLD